MASAPGSEALPQQNGYRALFHASPQPMWVFDVETLRFLAVNDAAIARYGYSREELLAMTVEDVHVPDDTVGTISRHRTKDGRTISVEVSSSPLVFAGRRAELVIPIDVGERLLLEEQLRQARRMEAVGRLAGGFAHDFNNLLTAVLGHTELALLKVSADDAVRRELADIRTAGERAAALTRQLLTFSRTT